MVEYTISLDSVFSSLADPTRRDILRRVAERELSIGEIAEPYDLTFAAVSKHLKIMERARLIIKRRQGKQKLIVASPAALQDVSAYLEQYRALWEMRFDALDRLLQQEQLKNKKG